MARVRKRKQETNGDCFRIAAANGFVQTCQLRLRQRVQDAPFGIHSLFDAESEFAADQRLDTIEEKVIELRSRLASDFDHVFKSGGGNEGDPCAFSSEAGRWFRRWFRGAA